MEQVVSIVANIAGKSPQQVTPETSLSSLGINSSIQILKVQSALERKYQQKLPFLADSWTLKRIAAQVGEAITDNNGAIAPTATEVRPTEAAKELNLGAISIGLDLEEVDNLPDTSNYRTHEFYQTQFTPEEISYALLKNDPKQHLCGIFCAKEALKKAHTELINLRMEEIVVTHRKGKPIITTGDRAINARFNFQLSISHTQKYAAATILAIRL